jgi:hypothetical protein
LRRSAHRLVLAAGSLAAALMLLVGFGLWRLTQGPVELDRLTPYVEEALNRAAGGLHISISGVRFAIDPRNRALDLQVHGVRLSGSDGEPFAAFSEASASFGLNSLLGGRLAPTRVLVERPMLRLVRDRDGKITLRLGSEAADLPNFAPEIIEQAAGSSWPGASFGLPRRIDLRDATLVLDDQRTGRQWQADRVAATIERVPEGLGGDLSMNIAIGAHAPELHAAYRYSSADRMLDLTLDFGAIEPAALASSAPELAPLAEFDFPISGSLETRVDLAALTSEGVRLDLGFGAGSLKSDLLPEGALTLRRGELHGVYAPESNQLRLAKLDLDLGDGTALVVKGSIDGVTPGLIAATDPALPRLPGKLAIALDDAPVAKVAALWPKFLGEGGRRWVVANIPDGVLDHAAIDLDLDIDPAALSAKIVSARGAMRYHDLTIRYLKGLPPVRKVSGTGTLTDRRLDFTPAGGKLKHVEVTGGSLSVTDLGAPVEWQTTDLTLAGPVRDVLEVIDAKPLHYAHDIGVDPADVAGQARFDLHVKIPLLRNLKFDDVEFGVKANLTGAAILKAAMGRDLSDGNFALEISRPGMHLQGNARFDGVPINVDGGVFFKPKNGPRARYQVTLSLDDEQRRRLEFNYLAGRVTGPVGIDLTYSLLDTGRAEAEARLDLRDASLSVEEAGWTKPLGTPGTARLVVDFADDRVIGLREIETRAAGLSAKFSLALTPDTERIERVDVERLVIGDNDLAGTVVLRPGSGWRVDLRGPRLDLTHWLQQSGTASASDPPLLIDARLGRLILGPRRRLREVSAHLLREGENWQAARIDAHFINGHELRLRFGGEPGKQDLTFQSDDLGSTLSLLDVTDNIVGGRVAVSGRVSDVAGKRVLHGHVDGEDYNLVRAPGFARALSVASLSAIGSMLAGSGIPFTTLRGDFTYSEDQVVLEDLLAYGGAIGVTANGRLELGAKSLDLQGTIVPAYTLNSIIGNVPVLGSLLLGGEGQGLFAATYRATGSVTDPQISVNPLSALTPGFLRRLLQPNLGRPPPAQEAPGTQ